MRGRPLNPGRAPPLYGPLGSLFSAGEDATGEETLPLGPWDKCQASLSGARFRLVGGASGDLAFFYPSRGTSSFGGCVAFFLGSGFDLKGVVIGCNCENRKQGANDERWEWITAQFR